MSRERRFKVVVQRPREGSAFTGGGRGALDFDLEREALDPIGAEIVEVEAGSTEDFVAAARDADAVIARHRRITRRVIEGLERCVVIGLGSVGSDTVDVAAASEAGIVVTHVPDVFIEEVADHTMMLLLAAARRLLETDRMVRNGEWLAGRPLLTALPRLWGQTLGLIAYGHVARATARRARPFGLRLLAYDPYVGELTMTGDGVEPVSTLRELLERSDFVSMHAPLNDETRRMLGRPELALMKSTAILINTGRGPTVDEAALVEALEGGRIAGAALDVLEAEPPDVASALLRMSNVTLTPHVASASSRMAAESRRRLGREIALVLGGRWPRSCVNPGVAPRRPLERWHPLPAERGPSR